MSRILASIDTEGLLARLDGMEEFVNDPRAAFGQVADEFLSRERRYIASVAWKPLKPASARKKARRGRPTRPLVGGALEKSLTVEGATYSVRRINKKSVVVGTRDPVANIHNRGTRGGRIPRRLLVRATRADIRAYGDIFRVHLRSARSNRNARRQRSGRGL